MPVASSRAVALASLALLGAYAAALVGDAARAGTSAALLEPWPLGGEGAWSAAAIAGLALAACAGWAVPGLALTSSVGVPASAAGLLARAFVLGVGYVFLTGLAHAALFGHAPGRAGLLGLLAAPSILLLVRRRGGDGVPLAPPTLALAAMLALTALLWPKLAREGLNGDGTEAYELARSLEAHPLPYWDLERAGGPGGFGTPMVNPFLVNSYVASAQQRLLGRGELAVRLPLVPALVIGTLAAAGLARRAGFDGALYAVGAGLAWLLWNCFWVGYEPAFTDLAEPAATDMATTALFLAGALEAARGLPALAAAGLVLASGILYSGPILGALFLLALARFDPARARATLAFACPAFGVLATGLLAYGAASGQLPDWWARLLAEYGEDLLDAARRVPARDVLVPLLAASGALPVLAAARWARLSPASKALLLTAGGYLALVLAHSYKNLHFLAPLPFLLAAPSLDAAARPARLAAVGLIAAGLALAWPDTREIHRENQELGRLTCVDGLGYEEACLGADVVYDAFSRPGLEAIRFYVGKHTFVRYGLALGGAGDCAFLLARRAPEGWQRVAGDDVAVFVRDLDAYARWRLRVPVVPSSWLFPRPQPALLPARAEDWPARVALDAAPGAALWIEPFAEGRPRARLLLPADGPGSPELELLDGSLAGLRVSGERAAPGYRLLELTAAPGPLPIVAALRRPGAAP
jgi:hypothetical protein